MPQTEILIIYTGGTIGMGHEIRDNSQSPLVPQGWDFLEEYMPSLSADGYFGREKGIRFSYYSFDTVIDSSDFKPAHWAHIAEIISDRYNHFDGFIIIHGTDTMAYTASALSFVFENLNKPVVLTGSQLPIFHPRTDGIGNLSNAIHIAAAGAFDLPRIPEVLICFNDKLLRGNRSTKSSSRDFSGFESPSFPSLGDFKESIRIWDKYVIPLPEKPFRIKPLFETNIITVTIFPGFNAAILNSLAENNAIKGVILRTFGSGNAPSDPEFLQSVKALILGGKVVLNISQCQEGFVNMNKYKTGSSLLHCGVIGGNDLTLEASTAKMMWALGQHSPLEAADILNQNIRGELTDL